MDKDYNRLVNNVGVLLEEGRKQAVKSINTLLIKTYWDIGKQIVEFEQKGKKKAEYGSALLEKLSKDLKIRYGKGFSLSNIKNIRSFYLKYKKSQPLAGQLSWSHYVELLSIENDMERAFYEKQCVVENWSRRELKRQINSALFYRLALSKDKKGILKLSKKGQTIENPSDLIKDPYILEFLKIPENYKYNEKEFEEKIIDKLQLFLSELGKGFSFIARQFRISLGNKHFYVDLVFYNKILKCYVLIDLKMGEASYLDIGQMNFYLNYFKSEENDSNDNPPIGLILSAKKDDIEIKYALGGISNNLFVSKYKLYLPNKRQLESQLRETLNN